MNVYDYITADTIEQNDQILYGDEEAILVNDVQVNMDGTVVITGYSYDEGDYVTRKLIEDDLVALWGA